METKDSLHSLQHERGQTDESLVSERGKTDESLSGVRRQNERTTNLKVQADRQEADEIRAQDRIHTDAATILNRASDKTFGDDSKAHTEDELLADNRLLEQRETEDAAVVAERLLMDAAILNERGLNKSAAHTLFSQERNKTDKNLSRERLHTDSQALRSSELLVGEKSSHSLTKSALTTSGEFLAIVSHDLRNPIGAILSYSELLLEESPHSENETRQWAEVIRRNAATALRLIGDILDMERFAEGKLKLVPSPQSLNQIVQEAMDTFAHVALEKKIGLKSTNLIEVDLVICDHDRMLQVLSNLVGNALKFTPANGSVILKIEQNENEFLISVHDTGQGIPEEQKAHIFERYAQLHNADRAGLGLGLYISKMLVEAHGGLLWVSSRVNVGSTFTFSLPKQNIFKISSRH